MPASPVPVLVPSVVRPVVLSHEPLLDSPAARRGKTGDDGFRSGARGLLAGFLAMLATRGLVCPPFLRIGLLLASGKNKFPATI